MDKQMLDLLNHFTQLGPMAIEKQSPQIARQLPELRDAVLSVLQDYATKRLISGVSIPMENIQHFVIPGGHGGILARVYRPSSEHNLPVLLYFHGGGFVIANLNSYDSSCRALANMANCLVVSIAYRQAPEFPYPAAHEDAFASYEWLIKNVTSMGGDPSRIAIGGESAGANLATSTCLQLLEKDLPLPVYQVLIYPLVDCDMQRNSYKIHANAKPLNSAMMT